MIAVEPVAVDPAVLEVVVDVPKPNAGAVEVAVDVPKPNAGAFDVSVLLSSALSVELATAPKLNPPVDVLVVVLVAALGATAEPKEKPEAAGGAPAGFATSGVDAAPKLNPPVDAGTAPFSGVAIDVDPKLKLDVAEALDFASAGVEAAPKLKPEVPVDGPVDALSVDPKLKPVEGALLLASAEAAGAGAEAGAEDDCVKVNPLVAAVVGFAPKLKPDDGAVDVVGALEVVPKEKLLVLGVVEDVEEVELTPKLKPPDGAADDAPKLNDMIR